MKHGRMLGWLFGTISLLLGTGSSAWASNYSGTLDFSTYSTTMEITYLGYTVTIPVGVDVARYDLGSALSGEIDVSFTTHTSFDPQDTTLALLFTTDPNQAIFSNPTSLAGALNPATKISDFLDSHVTGWQYYAYGTAISPGGTTNISGMFNPMTFAAGTHYYAFVVGGTAIQGGTLLDPSVSYTLAVGAVPEPAEYAMMMAGLGLVGMMRRRQRKMIAA